MNKKITTRERKKCLEFIELEENELAEIEKLKQSMDDVDFRIKGKIVHEASTILLIALAGALAGCLSWNDIAYFGVDHVNFFRSFIPGLKDVPSHDTFRRFFMELEPDKLEAIYRRWAETILSDKIPSGRHIAIDGKTIKKAININKLRKDPEHKYTEKELKYARMHVVTAYCIEGKIPLGQEVVKRKQGEITAAKELIDALDIREGDVITADALNTQRDTVKKIIKAKADYVMVVKCNQKKLYQAIKQAIDDGKAKGLGNTRRYQQYGNEEQTHGMIIRRTCITHGDAFFLGNQKHKWLGCKSFAELTTERTVKKTGQTTVETCYLLTSLPNDPKRILDYKISHWGIENGLHWSLDVFFKEDAMGKKMNSALNFSLLTKVALVTLKNDRLKRSLPGKRVKINSDESYLKEILIRAIKSFC